MPYGGTVTLAPLSMIIFAMRRGVKQGVFLGILYGILHFILTNKFSFHPFSIILDYVVPGAALGLTALGKHSFGFLLATLVRFISNFLSGIFIFASYSGNINPIIYSLVYNFTYIIPEMLIIFVIVIILNRFILYRQ